MVLVAEHLGGGARLSTPTDVRAVHVAVRERERRRVGWRREAEEKGEGRAGGRRGGGR